MADSIPETTIRREIFLQRFASFLINKNVNGTIQAFSRKLPGLLAEFGDAENLTRTERRVVARSVSVELGVMWTDMWEDITEQLDEMAIADAKYIKSVYKDFAGVSFALPADSVLTSHIANSVMLLKSGERSTAGKWIEYTRNNVDSVTKSINGAIWSGYTADTPLTNQQISQSIRGPYNRSTKTYPGGILKGRADALVRTGTNHFSNQARDRVYDANKSLIESRILIASLDNRTSDICMARNLMEWDINDNAYPRLPFHFNERSVWVVRVKGFKPLQGTKPAIGGQTGTESADFNRKFKGRKDTDIYNIEQVAATTTTDQFLRRQPKSFVQSTLGKAKAELFLNGGMSVERFTDATGRSLTLVELRTLNPKAFDKAGL